eukprot:5361200-Pleurochrysis_carterae.AAC.3
MKNRIRPEGARINHSNVRTASVSWRSSMMKCIRSRYQYGELWRSRLPRAVGGVAPRARTQAGYPIPPGRQRSLGSVFVAVACGQRNSGEGGPCRPQPYLIEQIWERRTSWRHL